MLMMSTASIALAWPAGSEIPELSEESELLPELELELDASLAFLLPDASPAIGATASAPAPGSPASAFSQREAQSAIARAIKSGYSVSAEQLPAEMSRGYAVSDKFKADFRAGFNAPVGDEMQFTAAGADTLYNFGTLGPAISWGWRTGVDMSLQASGTNAIESGPQFKVGGEQLALTVSPKVAHSFGTGTTHANDVAFAYAAGLKSQIGQGVALGIEAFGATSDIASVPGTALQTHRSTPGLYVGLGLAPQPLGDPYGSKFSLELGAMTGTTEAPSDWTGKIKAAVTW